ncbi:hypothetical protein EDB89DRAFT_1909483 [Lactarius sanguifluus]|nr:hypothetical protein EDB89DRAFT_1909483 [Lactarius sanguifluus]
MAQGSVYSRSPDWTPTSAATCQQPPSRIVNCIALAQETLKRFQTHLHSRWAPQHDNNAALCPHNSDAVPGPHDNNAVPCPHDTNVVPGPYNSATTRRLYNNATLCPHNTNIVPGPYDTDITQ